MTTDDVIKLAHEAGLRIAVEAGDDLPEVWHITSTPDLVRFAALVRAAALEEAAVLIADYNRFGDTRDCSAAIRALKEKT